MYTVVMEHMMTRGVTSCFLHCLLHFQMITSSNSSSSVSFCEHYYDCIDVYR